MSLELDKAEWLKNILDGSSSLKAFPGESISERESKKFEKGLNDALHEEPTDLILNSNLLFIEHLARQ